MIRGGCWDGLEGVLAIACCHNPDALVQESSGAIGTGDCALCGTKQ